MEIGAILQPEKLFTIDFLDGKITLVFVPSDEVRKITKQSTIKSWDHKHQPVEEFNIIEYRRLLGRRAVRGFEGFTSNGEPFPYSTENCDMLMTKWADFAMAVDRACSDIQGLMETEIKESEKK
jgi:hypothetical protein